MDDLKIYTKCSVNLNEAIKGVSRVSKTLGLKLNKKKCAAVHITKEIISTIDAEDNNIQILKDNEEYKYLGIEQCISTVVEPMDKRLYDAILAKSERIFNSKMTFRQKVTAYNTMVIAKARYIYMNDLSSNSKLSSRMARAREIEIKIRSILKESKMRFSSSNIAGIYVTPMLGGFGLKSLNGVI